MPDPAGAAARSYLYVPADRPDRLERAASRGADPLILDLEDAVPPGGKHEARRLLALELLSAVDRSGRPAGTGGRTELPQRFTQPMSFIGALPDPNDDAIPDHSDAAPSPGSG